MKIRSDFVTNSSSSSFILAFNSEDEIDKVKNELPNYWSEEVHNEIINDIRNGILSKEAALDSHQQNIDTFSLKYNGKEVWRYPWEETDDPTTEVGQFVKKYKDGESRKFASMLDRYNIFSKVEYSDHSELGCKLEQEIMPYLSNTLVRFSHH